MESSLARMQMFLSHSQLTELIEHCESTFVPSCKDGFERPLLAADFNSYTSYCNENLATILSLMQIKINNENPITDVNDYKKIERKFIVNTIILCGQHSSNSYWASDLSVELAGKILSTVLSLIGASSLDSLLCDDNQYFLKQITATLRPFLLKDTWKNHPGMVLCYSWLIKLIKKPHLGENLQSILPTALIIVDDFILENTMCGLECVRHIIKFCDNSDLSSYNQDQVILKALETLLHRKEDVLISLLLSVIVEFLEKKDICQDSMNINIQRNEFDPLIEIFLGKMFLEERLDNREAYGKALPKLIKARKLGILHHSPVILNIIEQYALEPTSVLNGLEALNTLTRTCWPRMSHQRNRLLAIIFKAYCSFKRRHFKSILLKEDFKEKCRDIFQTLQMASPDFLEPDVERLAHTPIVVELLKNLGIMNFVNDDYL